MSAFWEKNDDDDNDEAFHCTFVIRRISSLREQGLFTASPAVGYLDTGATPLPSPPTPRLH